MALDPLLLEVLACPEDKGPLLYFADEDRLYNPRLHRSYEVRDGIPVMLVDEATTVDDAEHDAPHGQGRGRAACPRPCGPGARRDADGRLAAGGRGRQPRHVRGDGRAARAGGRRRRGGAGPRRGCPSHDYVENVVVLGMGGSGIAGDVMVAVAGPVPARAGRGGEVLRRARLRRPRARWCSPCRSPATPRRRSRRPGRRRPPGPAWWW